MSSRQTAALAAATSAPTQPDQWLDRDRHLGSQLLLPVQPAVSVQGEPPCGCSGAWRYVLLPQTRRPIWRCLHCGRLHRGEQPILEAAAVPDRSSFVS